MENTSNRVIELTTVDRERGEKVSEEREDERKDTGNGNHVQPHPWRQGCQVENKFGSI